MTSPEALREAVERLEKFHAACDGMRASDAVISSHGPGGKQVMRADLRTLLSAIQEAREALGPFAAIATPRYPGEPHTSPLYGMERQTGTGELRLYSPFADSRGELPMFSADFRRAAEVFRALSPGGAEQ